MSTAASVTTAEELFRLPDNGGRCELIDGEVVEMAPPGAMHGFVSVRLTSLLSQFVAGKDLGVVFTETGFITARNPDRVLAPDGAFVRSERIAAIGIPAAYFPEAPSLVIEVVSPSDTVEEVGDKIERWFSGGVQMAWVVDPKRRTVTVYHALERIEVLTAAELLSGGPVIPGFTCRVADLFPSI